MTLQEVKEYWQDNIQVHTSINERFIACVNADEELKAYRDWIESKIFGFGERSFLWLWKLLIDEMPPSFSFLEIGVFRGQIVGLIAILTDRTARAATITGITPLDNTGGHWESDYKADIALLHKTFGIVDPDIIKGLSTEQDVISQCKPPYDIVYIDGGHAYEVVQADIKNYAPMVKPGGYLVIDDCANKYQLPFGYFRGIESVSRAVDEVLPNKDFKEIFSVVHNRVFQRITAD